MQEMQAELDRSRSRAVAGGGMVTVTLSGQGRAEGRQDRRLAVKPEEKEILEDLLVAAHADARAQGRA